MGEAKRRGTHAQRVAQAVERQEAERRARDEDFRLAQIARRERAAERLKHLSALERREVLFVAGTDHTGLALASMLALASRPKVRW